MTLKLSADLLGKLVSLEQLFPSMVQLFTVHYICNSKCQYCPVGRYNAGKTINEVEVKLDPSKRMFLSWSIFKKVAEEVADHPETILRFHGRGEPLMHPRFVDMVRFAKGKGIRNVTTFTNGILMDEKMSEDLLDAGIDLVEFSIDAFTPEKYKVIRGTLEFKNVVDNALRMIRMRDELKKATKIIVSAVNHTEFLHEKERFENFWNMRADKVIIRRRTTFNNRVSYTDWGNTKSDTTIPCSQPWTRFNISPSGKAVFCANDWGDELVVGDLNDHEQTIFSIWRSKAYEKMRQAHISGNEIKYCVNCTETDEARWQNNYEKILASFNKKFPSHR